MFLSSFSISNVLSMFRKFIIFSDSSLFSVSSLFIRILNHSTAAMSSRNDNPWRFACSMRYVINVCCIFL